MLTVIFCCRTHNAHFGKYLHKFSDRFFPVVSVQLRRWCAPTPTLKLNYRDRRWFSTTEVRDVKSSSSFSKVSTYRIQRWRNKVIVSA
ncbi:hypothetical protein ABKN59_002793 [Abortiporus biennis]